MFLDEIADISTALQVKLLRVLQEREYEPPGGIQTVRADARIIVATNQTPTEQVARGVFWEDLFYRLNVVRIDLPPLAQRKEGIPLLVEHFLDQFNATRGTRIREVCGEVLQRLLQHSLPGNIRELQNIVEYALTLCRGDTIQVDCLPVDLLRADTVAPAPAMHDDPLTTAEAEVIPQMLRDTAAGWRRLWGSARALYGER